MTWGTSAWGTSPWGLSAAPAFTITDVHARGETLVRVTLSRAAARTSSIAPGDALNPRTWTIVRESDGLSYTLLGVREVEAAPPGTVFELLLLQKLGPADVDHTLSTTLLTDPRGQVIGSPWSVTFEGVAIASDTYVLAKTRMVDLAKPNLNDGLGGAVFEVGASGDYEVESGMTLLRKLFLRRITTLPGGFFHLTNYGVGVHLKEPLPVPKIGALKQDLQRALMQEPEVDSVAVTVRMSTSGVLSIVISARIVATGITINDTLDIPLSNT